MGPLHRVNVGMHRVKAGAKAAQLSSAPGRCTRRPQGFGRLLPEDAAARPRAGWVVKGVYYAMDQNGRLVSLPLEHKEEVPTSK